MPYFAVVRERGPAWDATRGMREQDGWPDHAAFMDALAADGSIVLGGPVGTGDRIFLLIFNAESEEAIRARLEGDPWTPAKQLAIARIDPWQILLGTPPDA
ncbi:MAG TPA: YciI family protein [Thermomicrobiaceae bacterium]|nr:YciI family protein [Thermomicrobiaceae bacterium]